MKDKFLLRKDEDENSTVFIFSWSFSRRDLFGKKIVNIRDNLLILIISAHFQKVKKYQNRYYNFHYHTTAHLSSIEILTVTHWSNILLMTDLQFLLYFDLNRQVGTCQITAFGSARYIHALLISSAAIVCDDQKSTTKRFKLIEPSTFVHSWGLKERRMFCI